jgi:hypothetical protein
MGGGGSGRTVRGGRLLSRHFVTYCFNAKDTKVAKEDPSCPSRPSRYNYICATP